MNHFSCLLILFFGFALNLFATHNRGGYVAYRHVSGLTYEIEVVTYTVPDSPADRPVLIVGWGDGQSDTIARTNGGGFGEIVQSGIKENRYVWQHTYSSQGNYVLSMEDPNRNAGIINISNSVNVPFYIQSELRITNSNEYNNSARPTSIMYPAGQVGIPFTRNLALYDPDADFLTFELTTPRGENGQFVPGYSLPNGVSVNPLNGDFVWNSPQQQGEYNFAMIVNEYRDGEFVGSVTVDFQVTILPNDYPGIFEDMSSWPTNPTGDFAVTVDAGQSIELSLTYNDSAANDIQLSAFGEPFLFGNTATFNSEILGGHSISNTFNWTPSTDNVRCTPYIVSFRGATSNQYDGMTDVSLLVYVYDQAIQANPDCYVYAGVEEETQQVSERALLYPNPVEGTATVLFITDLPLEFQFELIDAAGKRVRSYAGSTQNTVQLNRGGLDSGMYFYRVRFSDGSSEQGKIVMQ